MSDVVSEANVHEFEIETICIAQNQAPASDSGGLVAAEMKIDRAAWPADGALQDLFFVVKNAAAAGKAVVGVDWVRVGW